MASAGVGEPTIPAISSRSESLAALAQLLSLSEHLEDRLLPLKTYARPLAVTFIGLGLYVLFVGRLASPPS